MTRLQALLLALGFALWALLLCLPVAFGTEGAAVPEDVALARTGVREAGLRVYERDDMAAIDAVIAWRAEHIYRSDYMTALRRFTHRAFERPDAPRAWIVELGPSLERPAAFPRHARWEGRNDRHWARSFAQARAIRRGEHEHRCDATPHTWGDPYDADRYLDRQPSARILDCGDTCARGPNGAPLLDARGRERCNLFLHLPAYEARFGLL